MRGEGGEVTEMRCETDVVEGIDIPRSFQCRLEKMIRLKTQGT